MKRISVLMTGDYGHREFREAVAWLREEVQLECVGDVAEAADRLRHQATAPFWIIVAQSRPGQIRNEQIERLHRASPLSRLVALLGSWCEGERRTGQPWHGVVRVGWHQWLPRLAREIEHLRVGASTWHFPRTATDVEQLLHLPVDRSGRPGGLIAIHADQRDLFDALAEACSARGYSSVRLSSDHSALVHGVDVVLWDAPPHPSMQQLANLASSFRPARVIALADWHRTQDRRTMHAAGAAAVLAKPLLVDDLCWHIDDLLSHPFQVRNVA